METPARSSPQSSTRPKPKRNSSEIESFTSIASITATPAQLEDGLVRAPTRNSMASGFDGDDNILDRIQTARSQHNATVGRSIRSRRNSRSAPLPAFGEGKEYPPILPAKEAYVVEFDGPKDPLHAQNWPLNKKLLISSILGYTTACSAFGSSIFSAAITPVSTEFSVTPKIAVLGMSLYVLGFAFGPTLWAPLSELKGRRLPIVISTFGFSVFSLATATSKDFQTVLITRFFAGFFGACPLAVVGAVFSDMFDNRTRGAAITVFSMAVFSTPLLAPFVGGFMVMDPERFGWRGTQYLVAIMGLISFLLEAAFLAETYPPQTLVAKAALLRRETRNWGIHARQEEIEIDLKELVSKNFTRPLRLLFGEPILLLLSIYMSFIYGLLYLFMTAYPLVFQGVRGFSPGVSGLAFLGMVVGQFAAGGVVLAQQPWYGRKLAANDGVPVPEWRLPSVIGGGVIFAAGIFWFAWTSTDLSIHWAVPVLSGLFTGFGIMSIFLQSLNYLVDVYLMFAASAIAGNTFLRSLCGAAFPFFGMYMFEGMGIKWASTFLAIVATVMIPIPIVFYKWGGRIRQRSSVMKQLGGGPSQDSSGESADEKVER